MKSPIGKVTATESNPTSCSTIRFWVHRDQVIRPFDIVKVPHIRDSWSYAIVKDLQYITDSGGHLANYVSSDFGEVGAQPINERMGATIAEAEVLYNTEDIEMPVRDGAVVEWADPEGIRQALGLGAIKDPIPAGFMCDSSGTEVRIDIEADYLLGPEGAHLNISGISGLATKTTYAMFLMNSLQQRHSDSCSFLIFNVKGADLLHIDVPEELGQSQQSDWQKCGLAPSAFRNVTYLLPYSDRASGGHTQSHIGPRRLASLQEADRVFNYFFDVETTVPKLGLLFSDIEDQPQTMQSIIADLSGRQPPSSWGEFRKEIKSKTDTGGPRSKEITVQSWRKFYRLLCTRTESDIFTERRRTEGFRFKTLREAIRDHLRPGSVLVIDIAPLPSYPQAFVFGSAVETVYAGKLGGEEEPEIDETGSVLIFADELNKYAPRYSGKGKSLTDSLLEVTERGRSLGVVLIGAEQFRSGVHDRILGNCSTNVFGRTSPLEVERCPDYKYFPKTHKWAVQRLEKGRLLLQHAIFRTALIRVQFPFPAYFQPKGR